MFRKTIVGVDGLDGGADALALARVLSAPDADIVLVHAYPFGSPTGVSDDPRSIEPPLRDEAEKMLTELAPEDARISTLVVGDLSPGRALHRVALERDADLIVVGSAHRGRMGRLLVGDVARGTLHGAPCAVAVASRGYLEHAGPLGVIGVGFDGNPQAEEALQVAARLAGHFEARLRVLAAAATRAPLHPGYAYSFDFTDVRERRRVLIGQALDHAAARLTVAAETEIVDAPASQALETLSAHVDLLVTGSRGWGAALRVVLGSTSDHLTRTAACPVLVVPGAIAAESEEHAAPAERPAPTT